MDEFGANCASERRPKPLQAGWLCRHSRRNLKALVEGKRFGTKYDTHDNCSHNLRSPDSITDETSISASGSNHKGPNR